MRKMTYLLFMLILVCGLCISVQAAPKEPAVTGVTKDTINIGMHASQTGLAAVFGLTYERVTRILFNEVNTQGGIHGRKIKFIVEDDRSDPAAGVAAVTKLIDRDKVFLIYGGPYTPVCLAAFPEVVKRDVIYWSPAASTPLLTKPFQKLTFCAQLTLDEQAIPVCKLAASMKPKKIAFIRENSEYGTITHDAAVEELKKYNLKITLEQTIDPDALSATAQISHIKREEIDVVIHGGTPKALAQIIREINKQGLKTPLLSFGGGSSAAIFQLVTTEAPIEYYAVSPLACPLGDPCTAEFMEKWKKNYPGEQPLVWTAQGYAATQFFVEGLRRAGRDLSTKKLIEIFETMPEFKSPLIPYPMKFTANNHRGVHGGYLDGFKDGKHYFFGDELRK